MQRKNYNEKENVNPYMNCSSKLKTDLFSLAHGKSFQSWSHVSLGPFMYLKKLPS